MVPEPHTLTRVTELVWHVGDVVRKLRQARSWTQKELAERAGVHFNTIVRLEDGDEGVQARTLKQVADALGVSRPHLWALVPSEMQEAPRAPAAAAADPVPSTTSAASHGDPFRETRVRNRRPKR